MLYYIEPEHQYLHSDRIISYLTRLPCGPNAIESIQNFYQSTFLLVKDATNNIQGGAQLFKSPVRNLNVKVREYLGLYYPHVEEVWKGTISLEIDESLTGKEFQKACQRFYCALYENLMAFGVKENAPFLCLTMESVEHLTIEMQGYWPFVFEVKPSSRDGMYNGVLSLMVGHQNTEGFSRRVNFNQEANLGGQV